MTETRMLTVTAHRQLMEEVVRAHLSTILFQRMFGLMAPATSEVVNVTYPVAKDVEVEQIIKEKMKELRNILHKTDRIMVSIKFYDRKIRKSSWFARTQDVCWEEWIIEGFVVPASEEAQLQTQQQLQRNLFEIIQVTDSTREEIPAITTTDAAPFPYEISVSR